MNETTFGQLTPHGWNEYRTWPIDIETLRYAEFFKTARRVAAARPRTMCHCSANVNYISLSSAYEAVPYSIDLAEGWGVDHNDFRLRVQHGPGCFQSTIDLCYTVSGGQLKSYGTLWWPKENGWWLHLDDHDHRFREAISAKTVVQTFLESAFPGKSYGNGGHRLITLTHEDALVIVEKTVDWFLDLEKSAPRRPAFLY